MAIQSTRAETELQNLLTGTRYIALYDEQFPPTATTNGTELTGNGYTRVPVAFGDWTFNGKEATLNVEKVFPTATGAWEPVGSFAILDSSSGGSILRYALLDNIRTVQSGDTARFQVGTLKLTFA